MLGPSLRLPKPQTWPATNSRGKGCQRQKDDPPGKKSNAPGNESKFRILANRQSYRQPSCGTYRNRSCPNRLARLHATEQNLSLRAMFRTEQNCLPGRAEPNRIGHTTQNRRTVSDEPNRTEPNRTEPNRPQLAATNASGSARGLRGEENSEFSSFHALTVGPTRW